MSLWTWNPLHQIIFETFPDLFEAPEKRWNSGYTGTRSNRQSVPLHSGKIKPFVSNQLE